MSLEALTVALADKLWRGKRVAELEQQVIAQIAAKLGQAEWQVLLTLDAVFEDIAAEGDQRLARSRQFDAS